MAGSDQAALLASAAEDMALCTLVGLEGSFSRRLGAQIAIAPDGRTVGSLSDGCLERQLASDAAAMRRAGEPPKVIRYGRGSPIIDFRLPCGGGLDILIDPVPDRSRLRQAADRLADRQEGLLDLPLPPGTNEALLRQRAYIPQLRVLLFGEGPEFTAFETIATSAGVEVEPHSRANGSADGLALGRVPPGLSADSWTAILLLFHDHEWERALLHWALDTSAFFIGAQGGATARNERKAVLRADGLGEDVLDRLRSPVGLIARARDPEVLALSVLSEIVGDYERLQPHQ
ncbi:MAG TPA: XdhC family protein [Sphingobium sp.]|uniref:XdhC family protein n=1 Tax=Sphingobium sp. TaxID=1912891 RepID=UPI002ED6B3E0